MLVQEYHTSIYGASDSIVSVPGDKNFIKAGYDMLYSMWHMEGFEDHKQFCVGNFSYPSSVMSNIAQFVKSR